MTHIKKMKKSERKEELKKIIIKNLYYCMQGNPVVINADIDQTVEEIMEEYGVGDEKNIL